jgi:Flp pilus assembly protein TadD
VEAERLLANLSGGVARAEHDAARAANLLQEAQRLQSTAAIEAMLGYAQALEAFHAGRLQRTETLLARARPLASGVTGARIAVLSARVALATGDEARALDALQSAIDLEPTEACVGLLEVEMTIASAPQTAIDKADALLADEGAPCALYNLRGLAHEAVGDGSEALEDFEHAIACDAAGAHAQAEDAFARAVARAPADPDAWLGRGLSRIAQGDVEGGRLDVDNARKLAPSTPQPLVALGDLSAAEGDLARAIELYRAALVAEATHAVAAVKLGNALARTGEWRQAHDAYVHALEHAPEMAAAHNGLGAALAQLGDDEGAAGALDRAAQLDANDPNPLRNLAALRKRQGNEQAATALLAQANALASR